MGGTSSEFSQFCLKAAVQGVEGVEGVLRVEGVVRVEGWLHRGKVVVGRGGTHVGTELGNKEGSRYTEQPQSLTPPHRAISRGVRPGPRPSTLPNPSSRH